MKKQYIETGKVVGTHGVRGEVRVDPWCDTPDVLCGFSHLYLDEAGEKSLHILSARVHKNIVLMRLEGVQSIEQAEQLRGKTLYLNRADLKLKEGDYLIQDLLGCQAQDEKGRVFGTLTQVLRTGANDVWQVTKEGKDYLVPAIAEVVRDVDVEAGRVVLRPMKGIFDDED